MICLKATLPINNDSIILPSKRFHVQQQQQQQQRRRQSVIKETLSVIRTKINFSVSSMELSSTSSSSSCSVLLTSGASGRVNALLSLRLLKSLVMLINAFVLLLFFPFQRRRSISSTTLASTEKSSSSKDDRKSSSSSSSSSPVVRVPAAMVPRSRTSLTVVEQDAITRRALAIKRVTQNSDDDEDDDDNNNNNNNNGNGDESIREISLFVTSRGDTLFTQSWTPVSMKTRGLVVLLHGLNEHSGRYNKFAKQLNSSGYKVYAMDWIGHGGSDGLHAYVHSLDYAVTDMKEFVEKVLVENPGFPCFCFGHSTGAAIVLKAVLDPKFETLVQGVVVTSPAVGVQASHPIVGMLAPVFSLLLPKYQFSNAYKKGLPVSRDPAALVAKYSDPLVYTGSVRMRTGSEVLRISSYLQKNLSRFTVPFIVLHGTADTVTDPEASVKMYEEASSTDKSLKLYEGYLHDLLFEPERDDITKEIINWLDSRTQG